VNDARRCQEDRDLDVALRFALATRRRAEPSVVRPALLGRRIEKCSDDFSIHSTNRARVRRTSRETEMTPVY
jgi:hypothetical protein